MNIRIKPLVGVLLSIPSMLSVPAIYAASSQSTTTQSAQIRQLQAQTIALQKQLAEVQSQLASMQSSNQGKNTTSAKQAPTKNKSTATASTSKTTPQPSASINSTHAQTHPDVHHLQTHPVSSTNKKVVTSYEQNILDPAYANAKGTPYGEHALANLGGFAVITSPYLHPNVAYDSGDFIVNFSSINKDANMLQQRQNFQHAMHSLGFVMPEYGSLLELSGEVEGQVYAQKDYSGNHSSNIDLTDAELDMQALINRWVTAFANFAYDDAPVESGNRTFNSNVYVDNALITFGNLDATKWRATIGQIYVPFGSYDSFLISDPINKTIFRTKGRPLLVGYGVPGNPGFSGSIYAFSGDTREGTIEPDTATGYGVEDDRSTNDSINQYGADANYDFQIGKVHTSIGASYIANVADSEGMQATGYDASNGEFEGFGVNSGSQVLAHEVPGGDLRAQIGIAQYTLIGEYTTALESFSPSNLSYNGHGAKPSAYHLEGVYSFNLLQGKPTTFAIGYDHSYQSLGLNVPEQRIDATLNVAFWRNTMASLELRHDMNYDSSDTATGNLSPVITPDGSTSNAITAQFAVYF